MTVYFVQRITDPSQVKIGHTDCLDARMQALSSECEGGVELLAQCSGDASTEAAFHNLCQGSHIHGEWYRRSPEVDHLIRTFGENVTGRRVWGRLKAVERLPSSSIDVDRELAHSELKKLMGRFGRIPVGHAVSAAHLVLLSINPLWVHRRVRAIWELKARRIDHYEIRDLQAANQMTDRELLPMMEKAS